MRKERYFVERNAAGDITILSRVVITDTELWGEYLCDGNWIEDNNVTSFIIDQSYADEIEADEASQIAQQMGGSLEA